MQKYKLLYNLFKLGMGHYQEHNDNVRKELLSYLETNGSDCQIEDGLRILDICHEENTNNDFYACCEIAAPIFDRLLSEDVTWDFYDIRMLAAVADYVGTYVEVYNLAEKILVKLEDYPYEEGYPFVKLAVYTNTSLRLLRGRYFDNQDLVPSRKLEKWFCKYIEEALRLCEEMGLEVPKAKAQIYKGSFYGKSDLINRGFYHLKELGENELCDILEMEAKEYGFFKKVQLS